MGIKDKKQTQTQRLDPASQGHVDQTRLGGTRAANEILSRSGSFFEGPDGRSIQDIIAPFLNPYLENVIGGVRGEFDHLRGVATANTNREALASPGAFNSSRHGVLEGTRLGELDRAQTSQIGGLLSSGFQNAVQQGLGYSEYQRALRERMLQEPIFRHQLAQGFRTGSLGPVGYDNTQIQEGSVVGDIAGLGLMAAGAFTGNPGAVAGGARSVMPSFSIPGPGNPTGVPPNFMAGLPAIPRPVGY